MCWAFLLLTVDTLQVRLVEVEAGEVDAKAGWWVVAGEEGFATTDYRGVFAVRLLPRWVGFWYCQSQEKNAEKHTGRALKHLEWVKDGKNVRKEGINLSCSMQRDAAL